MRRFLETFTHLFAPPEANSTLTQTADTLESYV